MTTRTLVGFLTGFVLFISSCVVEHRVNRNLPEYDKDNRVLRLCPNPKEDETVINNKDCIFIIFTDELDKK